MPTAPPAALPTMVAVYTVGANLFCYNRRDAASLDSEQQSDPTGRSSASRVTAVIPYYGYARQDRKDKPRVPISAKLVADLLSSAGTDRVLTMDLHSAQIQGFFNTPVDHLFAAPVIIDYISRLKLPRLTVVSPDAGGVERARAYAKRLDASLAIVDKRRESPNVAEVHHVVGEVDGVAGVLGLAIP